MRTNGGNGSFWCSQRSSAANASGTASGGGGTKCALPGRIPPIQFCVVRICPGDFAEPRTPFIRLRWQHVRNECPHFLSAGGRGAVSAGCAFHRWLSLLAYEDCLVKISCLMVWLRQARFTRAEAAYEVRRPAKAPQEAAFMKARPGRPACLYRYLSAKLSRSLLNRPLGLTTWLGSDPERTACSSLC
jgi:hypothetical protein